MMDVVGVGIAAIDVIQEVAEFPKGLLLDKITEWDAWMGVSYTSRCVVLCAPTTEEDSKGRALAVYRARGGNVTNALVVCAQLGVSCKWIGVSTDPKTDPDAAFIHADLTKHGIDTSHCTVVKEGSMPISYILCSRATGSRTIVHWRNVPEMTYPDFSNQMMKIANLVTADPRRSFWFHFEGRDMDVVARMMQFARGLSVTIGDVSPAQLAASPSVPAFVLAPSAPVAKSISVEIEALRYTWEQAKRLIECAHYVFVSKDYIRQRLELPTAVSFYDFIQSDAERSCMSSQLRAIICPWGEEGVHYLDVTRGASSTRGHVSAELVSNVIESVGAGDSFIGACVAALSRGMPLESALNLACKVGAAKCQQKGFEFPADTAAAWNAALQQ